ncbi:MAG: beta-L-arabinofuranosidase domain-containing protein, partial [Lachnospiraceae bacterium]|nr:beta-L-arabinofuranosidase domain-containing protein [Lachnospiraceae bacterium]
MKSLNIKDVDINGGFFGRYQDLIREKSIPYQWEALNDRVEGAAKSGCIENFRKAAAIVAGKGTGDEKFYGFVFQDSDLYKWLETAYYCIGTLEARKNKNEEIKKLRALTDEAVALIASAQCSDGYLDTYYIIGGLDKRFTNLCDNHELYCFGHMAEAAVAGASIGASALLAVVERYAKLLIKTFGPGEKQRHGYPGHEIAELALVKLYRLTGKKQYLDLAEYFIRERGKAPLYFEKEKEASGAEFFWKDSYMKYGYYQA